MRKIAPIFVAFSEKMNFKHKCDQSVSQIFGGFLVFETSVWGRGWDWNNRGRGRAPLEKHFSRDLLNEGAVAAEIVAETISLASIDAGSKWPELGLPAVAPAASATPAASMATADDPPWLPPRPLASSFETERPPPVWWCVFPWEFKCKGAFTNYVDKTR